MNLRGCCQAAELNMSNLNWLLLPLTSRQPGTGRGEERPDNRPPVGRTLPAKLLLCPTVVGGVSCAVLWCMYACVHARLWPEV